MSSFDNDHEIVIVHLMGPALVMSQDTARVARVESRSRTGSDPETRDHDVMFISDVCHNLLR